MKQLPFKLENEWPPRALTKTEVDHVKLLLINGTKAELLKIFADDGGECDVIRNLAISPNIDLDDVLYCELVHRHLPNGTKSKLDMKDPLLEEVPLKALVNSNFRLHPLSLQADLMLRNYDSADAKIVPGCAVTHTKNTDIYTPKPWVAANVINGIENPWERLNVARYLSYGFIRNQFWLKYQYEQMTHLAMQPFATGQPRPEECDEIADIPVLIKLPYADDIGEDTDPDTWSDSNVMTYIDPEDNEDCEDEDDEEMDYWLNYVATIYDLQIIRQMHNDMVRGIFRNIYAGR